jgi:hypothetical protein
MTTSTNQDAEPISVEQATRTLVSAILREAGISFPETYDSAYSDYTEERKKVYDGMTIEEVFAKMGETEKGNSLKAHRGTHKRH